MRPKKKNNSSKVEQKHPTPEEWLDWITPEGKILGQVSKKSAHQLGLWHVAVHIYVSDKKGNLLLQKRARDRILQPGSWDSMVGGHVSAGEDFLLAAQREMNEEIGVKLPLKKMGEWNMVDKQKNYLNREKVIYYFAQLKNQKVRPSEEFEEVGTIPFAKMDSFIRTKKCTPILIHGWKTFGRKIQLMSK